MGSRRHDLRNEFYEWERIGRGELVWNTAILPEPFFVPFFRHGAFLEGATPVDDGRHETFLSSIFGSTKRTSISRPTESVPNESLLDPIRSGEAPDYVHDTDDDLIEGLWTLPARLPWKPDTFSHLLYALGRATRPISFEFLAFDSSIEVQWTVAGVDQSIVHEAVEALPFASTLTWREDRLTDLLIAREPTEVATADLALEREFVFPIQTKSSFDPLSDLFRVLCESDPSLLSVVQIRFDPCLNRWAQSLWNLVSTDDGKPFFRDGADYQKAVRSKLNAPLFAVTVRLAVLGDDLRECDDGLRKLARGFMQFEDENGFVIADPTSYTFEEILILLTQRHSKRSGMLLNGSELLSLVHPPSEGLGGSALTRSSRKTCPVPIRHTTGFALSLGINEHASESSICGLTQAERLRHMHVLGASGTGKSTFLLNSICQDLESGRGLALLDPHGDLVEAVLDRLPAHRINDVVLFDPSDAEWPVGFNILEAHSEVEKNLLASDFVAIFERLSSSWGDQMTAVLGNAAMAFLESSEGGTLLELKRFLIEKDFRDRFLPTVNDPEIRYFWTHEFPLLRGTTQASLLTRLNGFLRHRLVRNIVSQRGERFDVAKMMNEGKILLAPLSQGLIGEENSWLLGSLLVSRFYQAALSRQSLDESTRRPFTLYLDEAHSFLTPSIAAILSGARKYGLGLVLSHQELGQFPSRESGILSSILTNCHTRVYFRLGDQDAKKFQETFDHFEAEDFRRLRLGEAICRIGGSDGDFSLRTDPPNDTSDTSAEVRAAAIAASRRTYAKPREEVEARHSHEETALSVSPRTRAQAPKWSGTNVQPAIALPKANEQPSPSPIQAPELPPEVAPEIPPLPAAPDSPLPAQKPPPRSPGRGGAKHKTIQQLIKQYGNGLSLRATIEASLPEGGSVDVLLEGGDVRMAFEVALKSPVEQEVRNIQKAIEAGIQNVTVVSDTTKHLDEIRIAAEDAMTTEALENVEYVLETQISDVFARLGAKLASTQVTMRGYNVKVNFAPPDEDVRANREADIHRAVANRREGGESNGI